MLFRVQSGLPAFYLIPYFCLNLCFYPSICSLYSSPVIISILFLLLSLFSFPPWFYFSFWFLFPFCFYLSPCLFLSCQIFYMAIKDSGYAMIFLYRFATVVGCLGARIYKHWSLSLIFLNKWFNFLHCINFVWLFLFDVGLIAYKLTCSCKKSIELEGVS